VWTEQVAIAVVEIKSVVRGFKMMQKEMSINLVFHRGNRRLSHKRTNIFLVCQYTNSIVSRNSLSFQSSIPKMKFKVRGIGEGVKT
jgi:hypothetical protein